MQRGSASQLKKKHISSGSPGVPACTWLFVGTKPDGLIFSEKELNKRVTAGKGLVAPLHWGEENGRRENLNMWYGNKRLGSILSRADEKPPHA